MHLQISSIVGFLYIYEGDSYVFLAFPVFFYCLLKTIIFSIYSEIIMRALEGMPGIKVGGYNMNNIRYADDTVLIADNENELQVMLDIVVRESEKKAYIWIKRKQKSWSSQRKTVAYAYMQYRNEWDRFNTSSQI